MKKVRVLFVCMGNICRSPAAEGVFRSLVAKAGLSDRIDIDSAGTLDYHQGELPDSRMRAAGSKRGYVFDSPSRPITSADLDNFDYVVCMDWTNVNTVRRLAKTPDQMRKLRLLLDWHPSESGGEVPDPYYGPAKGFDHVIDLAEAACPRLLDDVRRKLEST